MAEEYLYHYTKFETFVKYILPTKKLRFSLIKNSNDPFELREYSLLQKQHPGLTDFLKYIEDNSYFISFCCDIEENEKQGYLNSRMWSQYGDIHNGVCLALDKALLDKKVDELNENKNSTSQIFKNKIQYLKELIPPDFPQQLDKKDFLSNAKEMHLELFYQKTNCWIGENEYRYVKLAAPEENHSETFLDISGAIGKVYFGAKIKKENLLNIDLRTINYSYIGFEFGQLLEVLPENPLDSSKY